MSAFLNSTEPLLEESAHLVLQPQYSLNILERLQARKIESVLHSLEVANPFQRKFATSVILLLVVAGFALFTIQGGPVSIHGRNVEERPYSIAPKAEMILPEIKNSTVMINPPSYTRKTSRQQKSFNIVAEEGAIVLWQIQTNIPATEVMLIFNDGSVLPLSNDQEHSSWKTEKLINSPGFYQVKINNKLSELYLIQTVMDQRPVITIQSPKQTTLLHFDESPKIMVRAALADDYGIKAATISATISSGYGEAVKFKEQKISFENFAGGQRNYIVRKLLDCKKLGMQQGDELYFYISAVDNHNQETRSEVYTVTLQDTSRPLGLEGMMTGLDVQPEFFRSERQIIIETEQLIKGVSTISAIEFKKKSNDLGFDQRLLRLRYGKFLGEETTMEPGGPDEPGEQYGKGNTNDIVKNYGHEHDNAEDATVFDPGTKKQLQATLSEMWKAELKLRTTLPKQALPFEYKALRLLKDLQRQTRAYVLKTGNNTDPLQPDKRLTGDLSKISQPVTNESPGKPEPSIIILRRALGTLGQLKTDTGLNALSKDILQQVSRQLSMAAASQPQIYLPSLSSLKKILSGEYRAKDIDITEHGLQKMTALAERLPHATSNAEMKLSKQYFININKGSR